VEGAYVLKWAFDMGEADDVSGFFEVNSGWTIARRKDAGGLGLR